MARKHRKQLSPEAIAAMAILNGLDGPPDILTQERSESRPTPGSPGLSEIVTYRAAVVSDDVPWKDPTDMSARARSHGAREIKGWRRVWTIAKLHTTCPNEITEQFVKAAERLLADYEFGVEGASNGRTYDRIDGASSGGMNEAQLDAVRRFREALASLREGEAEVAVLVIVENWSVSQLAERLHLHRDRAHGRLYGALNGLKEHYWPHRATRASGPVYEPSAALVDLDAGSLAEDRMGRWRRRVA